MALLNRFLTLQPRWIATVLVIPILYVVGWLEALLLLPFGLPSDQLSLTGTLLSFVQFLLLMPLWARVRWHEAKPFQHLGLTRQRHQVTPRLILLIQGSLWAIALLCLIAIPLVLNGWATWRGTLSLSTISNAVALGLVVGVAEELIFRSWLQRELMHFWSAGQAFVGQALIFSLVHTRFNLGLLNMLGLLLGLFLLGLLLGLQRRVDQNSLWGSIGLHGELVAGWFVLQSDLLQISDDAPTWLIGPGGIHANPLGSGVAILALTALIAIKRKQLTADPTGHNAV